MFKECEQITIIGHIDVEINEVRRDWVGQLAQEIFKLNRHDPDAEDIAIDYFNGVRLSDSTMQAFLEKRGIKMEATYYPPDHEPGQHYAMLRMKTASQYKRCDQVIAPFNPTPLG